MNRFNVVRGRSVPKSSNSSKKPVKLKNLNIPSQANFQTNSNNLISSQPFSPKKKTITHPNSSPDKFSININEMKGIRDKIKQANEEKAKENKIKDEEVDMLNEKIHSVMTENINLQEEIEEKLKSRHDYEKKQKEIANYCNDLSDKFRNFEKTISNYENEVIKLMKENNDLQIYYDDKIKEIEDQNEKLKKRIKDREELISLKSDEMKEKTAKINNLKGEVKRLDSTFKERNDFNKNKFKELKDKYSDMLRKVYELQMGMEDKSPKEKRKEETTLTAKEKKELQIKEVEKKIESWEQDNEELVEEIHDLNNKYQEMSKTTEMLGNNLPTFFKTTTPSSGNMSGIMTELKSVTTKKMYG